MDPHTQSSGLGYELWNAGDVGGSHPTQPVSFEPLSGSYYSPIHSDTSSSPPSSPGVSYSGGASSPFEVTPQAHPGASFPAFTTYGPEQLAQMTQEELLDAMYKQTQMAQMGGNPALLPPQALMPRQFPGATPANLAANGFAFAESLPFQGYGLQLQQHQLLHGQHAHTHTAVAEPLKPQAPRDYPQAASPVGDEEEGARIEMLQAATRTIKGISPKITVTAESLANMSTHELDVYVRPLELTNEQEKQLKRQRRLIRNRESAHFSRIRKKKHVEELTEKITELTEANAQLAQELSAVKAQNIKLRTELEAYRSGGVAPRSTPGTELAPSEDRRSMVSSMINKAPSFYLLAICFVFGMVLSMQKTDQSTIFPRMASFGSFSSVDFADPIISRKLQTIEPVADTALARNNTGKLPPDNPKAAQFDSGLLLHCLPTQVDHHGTGRGPVSLAQKTQVTVTFTVEGQLQPISEHTLLHAVQVQCSSEGSSLYLS